MWCPMLCGDSVGMWKCLPSSHSEARMYVLIKLNSIDAMWDFECCDMPMYVSIENIVMSEFVKLCVGHQEKW